ncbi:putative outer membrane protein pmp20 precursor [Methanobrevibacter cuticularis]|uniref:Putative outer membrane protein pmp20 n=1 Tax=Methanobrevibacter cuticularis TaxID=47311 RepID=A0A166EXT3_9EURY|nr:DUF11 domain-containing protein [Methanobrevibacter cuticularis]KZX17124.1 putative outer membrane protein pmp20 precursor [Methanobrevibacter cuticularis]
MFNITFGNSLTLINITLMNGTSSSGGSIYNNGSLTLNNCVFTNNNVIDYGGAVYSNGTLNVFNSKFDKNTAYSGGAIYCYENTTMNITNSNFTNNKVTYMGGAIDSETGTLFNISNSNFINNTAGSEGGAIYTQDRYGSFIGSNITNSNFINNNATKNGGACSINGKNNFTIINSTFINNTAINNNGGAIEDYYNIDLIIINSTFRNNQANLNGGTINSYGITYIENSTFTNNKANNGGAIYSRYAMSINNSQFINNTANTNGGGIFNTGLMLVSLNTMTGNTALLGNMIYNTGNMSVLNLTYLNNSTIIVDNNTYILLNATLTDDMGNTVTGQNISFYVNGTLIGNQTSIEGLVSINYLVNHGIGTTTVTGDYAGHDNRGITIKNAQILITDETNVNGTIKFNKDKYEINETAKGNINITNKGSDIAYNVMVKVNLPQEFILNGGSVVVSHGYYDLIANIWYIGDLDIGEEVAMNFAGTFTKTGNYTIDILTSGLNFNDTTDSDTVLIEEDPTPVPPLPPEPTPVPQTPVPSTPINPINHEENDETNNNPVAHASMKNTGIPIIAIILVLLSTLGLITHRKE